MPLRLSYSLADQEFGRTKSLGIWNVSTQLAAQLAARPEVERFVLLGNRTQRELPLPSGAMFQRHDAALRGRLGRIWWDQWGIFRAATRAGCDWMFLPKGFGSFLRRSPLKLAAYVHDAMHDHYRRTYRDNPLKWETPYFIWSLRATLRQAKVIFTNSEFTRREVLRLAGQWKLPAPRVVTAGIGFTTSSAPLVASDDRSRILVLTGAWPHKLSRTAVDWMGRWCAERGYQGGVDWVGALPKSVGLPEHPGWQHHVRLLPDAFREIMKRARVVVYFSAYEGFGMPPVEATMAGAAAVYSAIPVMTEVMGERGFAFANDRFEDFTRAMDSALAAPVEEIAAWRQELSTRLSWKHTLDRILGEMTRL